MKATTIPITTRLAGVGLLFAAFLTGLSFNLSAQDSKTELILTPNPYLGVRTDSTLVLYQYQEGWKQVDVWDVTLPAGTEEMVMYPTGQLGVRIGNELRFYLVSDLFSTLLNTDTLDFTLPGQVDELILSVAGDLGVRTGSELKFYLYNNGWYHEEGYDYTLPANADELIITASGFLGVRTGRELKFYNIANKYEHLQDLDFTFPKDVDELIVTQAELGIRTGRTLKFYTFEEKWKPAPELDFKIEN